MSILSVDNISPIGSGTSVTINNAATLVLTNANIAGVTTASGGVRVNADGSTSANYISVGASDDLKIYHHSAGVSQIYNSTGYLELYANAATWIKTTQFNIIDNDATHYHIRTFKDGAVELYHNNSKKFETTDSGVKVTDAILEIADTTCLIDLMETSATNHRIRNGNGNFHIQKLSDDKNTTTNQLVIDGGTGETALYHAGNKTAYTKGSGFEIKGGNTSDQTELQIIGNEGQDASILLGADDGDDNADYWRMYSQASNNAFTLKNYAAGSYETSIRAYGNGPVELFHDNNRVFKTNSWGIQTGQKATNDDYTHNGGGVGWAIANGWTKVVFDSGTAGNTPFTIYNSYSGYNRYMWYIRFDGGVANYQSNNLDLCDERVKKDFEDVPSQWNNIKNIDLKHFRYQEDTSSDPLKIGVVAQQVETIYPDLIDESWPQGDADPNTHEKNTGDFYKGVKEQQLLMYAVKALQEAQVRIETLEAEVAALKGS